MIAATKVRLRWSHSRSRWSGSGARWMKARHVGRCCQCGEEHLISNAAGRCEQCAIRVAQLGNKIRGRASVAVLKAKKAGDLAKLDGAVACVDCGSPAKYYDHRDYDRPVDVVPVCPSCNKHRGMAIQTAALRAAGKAQAA